MGEDKRRDQSIPNLALDEGEIEETNVNNAAGHRPPPSRAPRPLLIVLAGDSVGEIFPVKQAESIIGRSRNVSFHLDDNDVSRHHARLTSVGGEIYIEDLGSANGTIVNDELLRGKRLLKDGDKIVLGSTTMLKFRYSDDVEETFQRRMFEAALRDGMTKAYNKKYLLERLDKELAFSLRHGTSLSLLMLDLDHFKKVNDTYGHPAGDALLIALAGVVNDTIRKEDVFARYGGEEFAVLCRAVDVKSAALLAERLRVRVEAMRIPFEGTQLQATVSIGVAGYPELNVSSASALVVATDGALYDAKRGGRNRVVIRTVL